MDVDLNGTDCIPDTFTHRNYTIVGGSSAANIFVKFERTATPGS